MWRRYSNTCSCSLPPPGSSSQKDFSNDFSHAGFSKAPGTAGQLPYCSCGAPRNQSMVQVQVLMILFVDEDDDDAYLAACSFTVQYSVQ